MIPVQLAKYGFVGAVSTAIHFIIAALFVYLVAPSLILSNILGFGTAFIWSYFVQSKFVFQSSLSTRKGFRFFLVQITSLFIAVSIADTIESVSIYLKIIIVVFMTASPFQ